MITILGLDADDTLWQNEEFFRLTQSEFANRLAPYMGDDPLQRHLIEVERRNIERYGYGIKGFMLSMIETAIEVSDGQIPTQIIQEILTLGHDMLDHPINLLPGVAQALPNLAENYRVILITKGDLLHQEQKIARSGLAPYFDQVEIVSEKDVATYAGIFGNDVAQSVMVGNSMKSDILPALEAGAAAVHIPAQFEWDLEKAEVDWSHPRAYQLKSFDQLAAVLPQIR